MRAGYEFLPQDLAASRQLNRYAAQEIGWEEGESNGRLAMVKGCPDACLPAFDLIVVEDRHVRSRFLPEGEKE